MQLPVYQSSRRQSEFEANNFSRSPSRLSSSKCPVSCGLLYLHIVLGRTQAWRPNAQYTREAEMHRLEKSARMDVGKSSEHGHVGVTMELVLPVITSPPPSGKRQTTISGTAYLPYIFNCLYLS